MHRPIEVGLALSFGTEKRPERGREGRRQILKAANTPVFDDLYLIVPDKAAGHGIGKHNATQTCYGAEMPEIREGFTQMRVIRPILTHWLALFTHFHEGEKYSIGSLHESAGRLKLASALDLKRDRRLECPAGRLLFPPVDSFDSHNPYSFACLRELKQKFFPEF